MIIETHREFFRIISLYNKAGRDERPSLLKGYIQAHINTHPNQRTRSQLASWIAKETGRLSLQMA